MKRITYSIIAALVLLAGGIAYHAYVATAHDARITVNVKGTERTAILHVPAYMDRSHPYPLVLGFHQVGGSAEKFSRETQLFAKGEREGFLVLCPEGTLIGETDRHGWNSGAKEFAELTHNADDVAFVKALLAKVEAEYPVDTRRVYATGFSNGAQMSYLLALKMADVFAAIAPMSGARLADGLKPSRPVPVLHFHGAQDQVYPYGGGLSILKIIHNPLAPVPDVLEEWYAFNHVPKDATIVVHGNWITQSHNGAAPVNLVLVMNMDHQVSKQPDAITMALQFFKEHPMP
jgi:poly(3-hydroxybutyrate) depolymerase